MNAPTLPDPGPARSAQPRQRGRKPASYASVRDLGAWMRQQPQVQKVVVIRTSDRDKAGFKVMFKAGIAMLPDDLDMQQLALLGPEIVTDAGARDRERLGAYEIRRGSVPGGKGYALLGYAFVIGTTLVILYLETARSADVPGPTKDQTKNAFTEALCTMLRHFRPTVCHTPLVSRIFRNMDFAGQVLRTLRDLRIRLYAEGSEIPLGKGDEDLMAMLRAWFAAREADGLVARLGNIEIGMYLDEVWYLGEHVLPFTWRPRGRLERNVLTGETVRVVDDKHALEAVAEAQVVLQEFLRRAAQRATSRHQLGMMLGAAGVVSRAPAHAGKNVRLDSRPETQLAANAATTLLQERWLTAWETGLYRRSLKLKSDPRLAMPQLADRVIDVDGELFLEVETPMPSPVGGWDVADLVAAVRQRLRADAKAPAAAARSSKTGMQKPLNGLCDYVDAATGRRYALTSLESGETYELRFREGADALDGDGVLSAWAQDDPWLCSIPAAAFHRSVAGAMREALISLEAQTAQLVQRVRPVRPVDGTAERLVRATRAYEDAQARLDHVKERLQTLEGLRLSRALTEDELEQLEELPADERQARRARRKADQERKDAQRAQDQDALDMEQSPVERTTDAEFGTIELVTAALAETSYRAPDALHHLLSRVLCNLQVRPVAYDTAVTWSATLVVPLADGSEAELSLHAPQPVPSSKRAPRRGDSNDSAALTPDKLARLFLLDGRDLLEIGALRGVRGDGAPDSSLFRQTIEMLTDHLGVSRGLACAAADMPASLRPGLYEALCATGPLDDPWLRHKREVYLGPDAFGPTWCMGQHREARKVITWLQAHAEDPLVGAPAWQVAAGAGVPYSVLLELSIDKRAQVRTGSTYGRGPLLGRNFGPGSQGNVFLLACPQPDCLERFRSGRPGVLVPIATPETTSRVGRPGETLLGTLCSSCQRLPGLKNAIAPAVYLQPWVGGRRARVTTAEGVRWVGTRL